MMSPRKVVPQRMRIASPRRLMRCGAWIGEVTCGFVPFSDAFRICNASFARVGRCMDLGGILGEFICGRYRGASPRKTFKQISL
eukprot:5683851-Amphidinium_carterae.1